ITGAGQGLGRELAIGYASLGATVVCWDINKEINEQTVDEIKKIGKSLVYGYRCDVSDKDEVFKTAEKVRKEVGDITVLINNAAVGPFRAFHDYNIDDISWVINVNFMAHYWASILREWSDKYLAYKRKTKILEKWRFISQHSLLLARYT
ncbi:Epidermal retinal dehydrogenase 2, partial [Harpegnathos saltator]